MQVKEVKKKLNSLLPFHPLTNIEISEYYKNEPRFNGVYSRDNLPNKTKKGAYVTNLYEYENTGTHWVSLFAKANEVIYFDSFSVEHIPKEINKFIGNKKIKASIFRIQAYDSIMCGYFCTEFINYMLKGKTLLDYTNLFSPAGITGASLTLVFTIGTGISKSLLKLTKKRKKKHNETIVLAKNKLNMIDTLLSSALNDSEISHEEFTNIINEANIYENIKENIKELTTEPSSLERTTL